MTDAVIDRIVRELGERGDDLEASALVVVQYLYENLNLAELIELLRAATETDSPLARVGYADALMALFDQAAAELGAPPAELAQAVRRAVEVGITGTAEMFAASQVVTSAFTVPATLQLEWMDEAERRMREFWGREPPRFRQEVHDAIVDGLRRGQGIDQIGSRIRERLRVSRSRASLIARNEVGSAAAHAMRESQRQAGVQEYIWRTATDRRVRPEHAARNGKAFRWDSPPGDGHPGEPVNCLPSDVHVEWGSHVERAFRRWFNGELTEIVTESGKSLKATPNHPVLTPLGWKAIGALNVGDEVIEVGVKGFGAAEYDEVHRLVPSIQNVFEALHKQGVVETARLSRADFHGDGADGEVDVVNAAGLLRRDGQPYSSEGRFQLPLAVPDDASPTRRPSYSLVVSVRYTAYSIVGCRGEGRALVWGQTSHTQVVGRTGVPEGHPSLSEPMRDTDALDPQALADAQHALAIQVSPDDFADGEVLEVVGAPPLATISAHASALEVTSQSVAPDAHEFGDFAQAFAFIQQPTRLIHCSRRYFSGHVYNLQTPEGWYVSNAIVTHNCRCVALAIVPSR